MHAKGKGNTQDHSHRGADSWKRARHDPPQAAQEDSQEIDRLEHGHECGQVVLKHNCPSVQHPAKGQENAAPAGKGNLNEFDKEEKETDSYQHGGCAQDADTPLP